MGTAEYTSTKVEKILEYEHARHVMRADLGDGRILVVDADVYGEALDDDATQLAEDRGLLADGQALTDLDDELVGNLRADAGTECEDPVVWSPDMSGVWIEDEAGNLLEGDEE